jgi:hypothetical protein
MAIVRIKKEIRDTINLHKFPILHDKRLSFKAKGILTYLLGHGDGWECNFKNIANHATDGLDSVKSGMKELQELGYAKKMRKKNPKTGRIEGWSWLVYELPPEMRAQSKSGKSTLSPKVDYPRVENSISGKSNAINTDRSINTEKERSTEQKTIKKPALSAAASEFSSSFFSKAKDMGFHDIDYDSIPMFLRKGFSSEQIAQAFESVKAAGIEGVDKPTARVFLYLKTGKLYKKPTEKPKKIRAFTSPERIAFNYEEYLDGLIAEGIEP